jgi:hypothetical protein
MPVVHSYWNKTGRTSYSGLSLSAVTLNRHVTTSDQLPGSSSNMRICVDGSSKGVYIVFDRLLPALDINRNWYDILVQLTEVQTCRTDYNLSEVPCTTMNADARNLNIRKSQEVKLHATRGTQNKWAWPHVGKGAATAQVNNNRPTDEHLSVHTNQPTIDLTHYYLHC